MWIVKQRRSVTIIIPKRVWDPTRLSTGHTSADRCGYQDLFGRKALRSLYTLDHTRTHGGFAEAFRRLWMGKEVSTVDRGIDPYPGGDFGMGDHRLRPNYN